MNKSLSMLEQDFESSSSDTPQFLQFYKQFKKDFTTFLKSNNITNYSFYKGHFEVCGFFQLENKGKIFYFRLGDVRWFKTEMLIREAESFEDYTGKINQRVRIDSFVNDFIKIVFN